MDNHNTSNAHRYTRRLSVPAMAPVSPFFRLAVMDTRRPVFNGIAAGLSGRSYRQGHETRLGAFLDINIDALGLLIAPLLAVWYGQLPGAYLSVSAAYYLLVFAIWLRKKYSKPVFKIPPRRSARIIAGFQMGFVGVALLPAISPPLTTMAAYIFMIPLLAGFTKDWMIASGNRTYGPN